MPRQALILALVFALAASAAASQRYSRQEADQFDAKLTRIVEQGKAVPRGAAKPRTTQVTEREVNAYFEHHLKDDMPVGIVDPAVRALGNGRLSGRALVDLDAVRTQKPRGWMDPMGYLTGRMPVTATGTLTTRNGVGRFQLESAEVSGVTVPKSLLQELVSYYSKTPENPAGFNMDDEFELPSGIREIQVGHAQATVVQ
jgi:hypothetical protein